MMTPSRSRTSAGTARVLAMSAAAWVAPACVMFVPLEAAAQLNAVDPYHVVVSAENVNLRCGAGSVWYAVASLSPGDVLRVDGVDAGWLRVIYPSGVPAVIKATDAMLDEARGSVKLTAPSRLLASNPRGGVFESWQTLLEKELASGTELTYIETLKDASGGVSGYRVIAPEGARGYVSERFVRAATDVEIAAVKGAQAPPPVAMTTPPASSGSSETTPGAEAPAQAATTTATTPVAAGGAQEAGQPAPAATTEPAAAEAPIEPVALVPVEPPAPAGPSLKNLDSAYDALKSVPTEDAEIEPLIAEYERFLASLPETSANSGRRAYARAKIDLLRARGELQNAIRAAAEVEMNARRGSSSIEELRAALAAKPRYTVVGRLSASTVYDGTRLPLMYRILSIENFPGRTLAYVTPAPGVELTTRIGSLVGVVGDGAVDAALGVPVLTPKRVDFLATVQAPPASQP